MRFVVLPLLLLGAAFSSFASVPPLPPRPVVVLVHGRGQLGTDSAALRADWKRDLDSALVGAGLPTLRNEDVRLAWYADVLDPATEAACARDHYSTDAGFATVARGFLASLVSMVPDSVSDADVGARSLLGDMLYVVDPATRCAAETRLGNVLAGARAEGRPVIVVAYSLGAVVSYEYLRRAPRDSMITHLVTIGSPLGLPVARELLTGGGSVLQAPPGVRWVNIYDPDDAFAAPLLLGNDVVDRVVRSRGRGDPHGVGRYLRDAETGAAVARALCESTGGGWGAGCSALAGR